MAFYKLNIKREAEREISALPKSDLKRVIKRIQGLREDPRPMGCEKLKGEEGYRIRQGDYRVVYSIDDLERIVRIIRVGNRKEVYR